MVCSGVLLGLLAILWVRKVFNDPLIEVTVVLATSLRSFSSANISFMLRCSRLGCSGNRDGRELAKPGSVRGRAFHARVLGVHSFCRKCHYFHRCRRGDCPKDRAVRYGLRDFGACLFDHSFVRAANMGIFYPLMRSGIRTASHVTGWSFGGALFEEPSVWPLYS